MRGKVLSTVLWFLPVTAAAQVPCTTDARQVVNAAYLQVLERPVNRQVIDPLVARLAQGQTSVREIVRTLAMSPDHRQRFLSAQTPASRETAVRALYRHLLGREPDESGLRAHADAFANGDPTPIIDSLVDSPEYLQAWGDDTVPGGRARFCSTTESTSTATRRNRFAEMDRSGDGVIQRNEWTGTSTAFAARDWNNDGVLSGSELRVGARRAPAAADEADFSPSGPVTWTPEAFRQLDRNRDSRVTSSEWYYAPEFFLRADRNRDGSLTLAEFSGTSTNAWDDDRDMRFQDLDVNGNGRVEAREWQGSLDAFQWLDRNNDNVLTRTEVVGEGTGRFNSFMALDVNANGTLSINEWRWSRASFTRYDADGDGVLSRQEFAAGGGAPAIR